MLKLKLQHFGHLMWRTNSLEKTLMLGRIEGRRRTGRQKMRWLDGITDLMDMSLSKLWEFWRTEKPGMLQSMELQRVRHNWGPELTDSDGYIFRFLICLLLLFFSQLFVRSHQTAQNEKEWNYTLTIHHRGFPGGANGKEPTCQCRRYKRCRFDPWVGKIPWRRAWQSTPVFLPGESHGQRSLVGYSP